MYKGFYRSFLTDRLSNLPDMCSLNYVEHKNIIKNFPLADFADILKIACKKKIKLTFKAEGASMSPFVKTGDILTINLNDFDPSIGTVVG